MCMCAHTDVYHGTRMAVTGHLSGVGSLHPPWVGSEVTQVIRFGLYLCGNTQRTISPAQGELFKV